MTRPIGLAAGALLFVFLGTANSGGYRYGVSDQAYYQPAVVHALHAETFPRDRALLDVQARRLWSDEALALVARATGLDLPAVFLTVYVLSLAAVFASAVAFGAACRFSGWAMAALVLLMTFRHRIARTGANSLEGYMHPRVLAFALGVAALAGLARGRLVLPAVLIGAAAAVHPTTGVWFATVWTIAAWVLRPDLRRWLGGLLVVSVLVGAWLLSVGPMAGRLVLMDQAWLDVLAEKDYLFPTDWPAYAWVANLLYPVVIVAIFRKRARLGVTAPGERALVAGLIGLALVFAISVPFTAMRLALAVQLQVSRVFWILDFAAAAYVAWWLTNGPLGALARRRLVVAVLALASLGRGTFLLTRPGADRNLLDVQLPATPWVDVLTWLRAQPPDWHILADPAHGWKFGISVRVGAEKDTLVESSKDSAIAMYDRTVAMRVADRLAAVGNYDDLTDDGFRALARRYDLDVAIITADRPGGLSLPVLYANSAFVVVDLR